VPSRLAQMDRGRDGRSFLGVTPDLKATAGTPLRITHSLKKSASKRLPAPSRARTGPLKRAALPIPSLLPAFPGRPAKVLTTQFVPSGLTLRIVLDFNPTNVGGTAYRKTGSSNHGITRHYTETKLLQRAIRSPIW
jgi:hypothetical protein